MTDASFEILAPEYDELSTAIRFRYRLGALDFSETVAFPDLAAHRDRMASPVFTHLADLTAAVLGVSYYKLRAPLDIVTALAFTADEKSFLLDVYENGLGEFYARNALQRFGRITITSADALPAATAFDGDSGALVLVGGGKDSLVSLSLLEAAGLPITLFAVNPKGPIAASAERAGRTLLSATRTLDPEMLRLSREPGYYNGHVPSTAINSMIAALAAVLAGHERMVLSNERSASEGNLEFDGRIANHQHSKSLEFERRIASVLSAATAGGLDYFSLLRPYSEARIAALFARSTRFDDVFSSCNRNFTQIPHQGPLWCGNCPKCRFVYLIFAPVMDRARLVGIFGRDLLDDPAALPEFRELTGLAGHKPWECVGEILEAAACLFQLRDRPEWRDSLVVATLLPELEAFYGAPRLISAFAELMTDSADHLIPPDVQTAVNRHALASA